MLFQPQLLLAWKGVWKRLASSWSINSQSGWVQRLSMTLSFVVFILHFNDVMISHFAANNGRQMRVNGHFHQRGEGLLKDIDFEWSQSLSATPFPHAHCESNLVMTNTVISFTIDMAIFELQMFNLDIWMVWIRRLWDDGETNARKWSATELFRLHKCQWATQKAVYVK